MAKDVKIYGSAKCPGCNMAKKYFEDREIELEFIEVTGNEEALAEMRKVSGGARSIPVIVACGKVIVGFDQAALEDEFSCLSLA